MPRRDPPKKPGYRWCLISTFFGFMSAWAVCFVFILLAAGAIPGGIERLRSQLEERAALEQGR
jgi:hypothetical protein